MRRRPLRLYQGSPRCAGERAQHVAPLQRWWAHARISVGAGMMRRCLGGSVGRSGCWEWQGCGARLPGAAGAGRPARARWRWARHADGADPAPSSWWRGVRQQHPVRARRHSDGHAPPQTARRGVCHDPVPSARHSDSADPAPPPYWRGVRQHPVPLWRHSVGHASPQTARRGVVHDPVPSAGWRCHRRSLTRWYVYFPAGRCPVLQDGLASATSQRWVI